MKMLSLESFVISVIKFFNWGMHLTKVNKAYLSDYKCFIMVRGHFIIVLKNIVNSLCLRY